jgi:formylglycine-generating enzyme
MMRSLAIVTMVTAGAFVLLAAARRSRAPIHDWQCLDAGGWQIVGGTIEDPQVTDERERTRGPCPEGMVRIEGAMKVGRAADDVERAQNATCVEWEPNSAPGRCLRFDEPRWTDVARGLERAQMQFCIDRFEYPNRRGAYPVVATTWEEARNTCAAARKRLCTEDEWTFACEGPDALPYPYGYARDPDACVIDRRGPAFDADALANRNAVRYASELDRLWRGEPSGTRPRCISRFGVYDLTGNVDEWTVSSRPYGPRSILKGGYWGPIRARCRPSTRAHGEQFAFYQIGFRCCS